jgi:adenylate cyclase, class 2
LGAEAQGVLVQCDTYFQTQSGRLKLREEGAVAWLISYERADLAGQRESRYRIIEVAQAPELRAALSETLGVKVEVRKERRLFLWQGNVRIHLDKVDGLGDFIEFEAIVGPDSDLKREQAQVAKLREEFVIGDAALIGGSYCDLALRNRGVADPLGGWDRGHEH